MAISLTAPISPTAAMRDYVFLFFARWSAAAEFLRWPNMRTLRLIGCLFVCGLLLGCSHTGDFGEFVGHEVTRHGGCTKTNVAPPSFRARWTMKEDENGFQAEVRGASVTQIDDFMLRAFGPPLVSATNDAGQPHQVWTARDIGVAIQVVGRPSGAYIVCLRGTKSIEDLREKASRK